MLDAAGPFLVYPKNHDPLEKTNVIPDSINGKDCDRRLI